MSMLPSQRGARGATDAVRKYKVPYAENLRNCYERSPLLSKPGVSLAAVLPAAKNSAFLIIGLFMFLFPP